MNFKLEAAGAQQLGQGIGSIFKAMAMGPMYRQQAEQDARRASADLEARQMLTRKAAAEADKLNAQAGIARNQLDLQQNPMRTAMLELGLPTAQEDAFKQRLETGQWGGAFTTPADGVGPTMPTPADDGTVQRLGQTISLLQRMYGTGSNVAQGADAALSAQRGRLIDRAVADPSIAPNIGAAYAAIEGRPLFDAVGTTGYSLNQFTGAQTPANELLARMFGEKTRSEIAENNAQAGASSAQARRAQTDAELTNARLRFLNENGRLPGAGAGSGAAGGGASGLNIGQMRDDIRADYNAMYPIIAGSGMRAKDAPTFDEFTRQWLTLNNIPEAEFYGTSGRASPVDSRTGGKAATATTDQVQETKTLNGKTYQKVNGQWFEVGATLSGAPSASPQPAPSVGFWGRLLGGSEPPAATPRSAVAPQPVRAPQSTGATPPMAARTMPPEQRQVGTVYQTPRGLMEWTGKGWLPWQPVDSAAPQQAGR